MRPSSDVADRRFRHSQVAVGDSSIHVVEAGDPQGAPFLFLHGWPESWRSWKAMMVLASPHVRAMAIDLPGVGESTGDATDGSKGRLAETIHQLLSAMRLHDVTLVGHDIGGMIVYAYLRAHRDLRRAVIMDVVLPGLDPWDEVVRNPSIWHFALHAVPSLPERLVQGRQADYFRFFYDGLSADAAKITAEARAAYVDAYATDAALSAGFAWYRAFARDTEANQKTRGEDLLTPLLYLRGDHERGNIGDYVDGLEAAGAKALQHRIISGAGHFPQEEAPEETWSAMARFAGIERASRDERSARESDGVST